MVSALVCYLIGKKDKKGRDYFADAATGMELAAFLLLFFLTKNSAGPSHQDLMLEIPEVCGMGLHFVLDDFRMRYCGIVVVCKYTVFQRIFYSLPQQEPVLSFPSFDIRRYGRCVFIG